MQALWLGLIGLFVGQLHIANNQQYRNKAQDNWDRIFGEFEQKNITQATLRDVVIDLGKRMYNTSASSLCFDIKYLCEKLEGIRIRSGPEEKDWVVDAMLQVGVTPHNLVNLYYRSAISLPPTSAAKGLKTIR